MHGNHRRVALHLHTHLARACEIPHRNPVRIAVAVPRAIRGANHIIDARARDQALRVGGSEHFGGHAEAPLQLHLSLIAAPRRLVADKEEIADLPQLRVPPDLVAKAAQSLDAI